MPGSPFHARGRGAGPLRRRLFIPSIWHVPTPAGTGCLFSQLMGLRHPRAGGRAVVQSFLGVLMIGHSPGAPWRAGPASFTIRQGRRVPKGHGTVMGFRTSLCCFYGGGILIVCIISLFIGRGVQEGWLGWLGGTPLALTPFLHQLRSHALASTANRRSARSGA